MIAEIPVIALLVLFALIVVLLLAAESKRRQGIDDEDLYGRPTCVKQKVTPNAVNTAHKSSSSSSFFNKQFFFK